MFCCCWPSLLGVIFLLVAGHIQAALQLRNFCLGTENGRNVISVDRLSHYARLAKSFVRCRRIIGNLEITHIDQRDVDKWEALTQIKLRNATEKEKASMPVPETPFQFLADLEEITGYLLIFNFNMTMLSLPRLRIIWGERLHDGNALQIDSNPNMRILSLPSLRTIEEGNLTIRRSPHLCYLNRPPSGGGTGRIVDYNEILSRDLDRRLSLDNFSRSCRAALPCAKKCNGHCFGPGKEHCQTVYRKNCNSSCESKACFVDDQGTSRCCDDACAGGCYAEGRDQCVACKMFEQDSKCVNQCSGTHAYNPNTLERELLPEEERRFAYGRHCVPQCPAGSLVDDEHCVSRCSWGKYRDSHRDDRQCVPCPGGVCPRVCQLQEPLDAANIQRLANCSEIEGNLELLGYAFQEHLPPGASPIPGSEPVTVPALNASQLDVLRSVRVVTGYVVLDGSRTRSKLKPRSLSFLENLEVIEGRKLYYEKYALYVIGNPDLQWLGLRSLRKIENGHVSVRQNGQLCYGQPVPFMSLLGVSENIWLNNMQQEKCDRLSRKCDSNCDPASGCWGPGPAQCVRCRRFSRDGECADSCPELGYFVAPSAPTKCQRCHEQCQRCHGPSAFDCSACNNFNLWLSKVPGPVEQPLAPNMDGALPKCVAKCPNMTFALDGQCQPCSPACRDGCTGPADKLAAGGCNRCEFAFEESKDKFRCLFGVGQDTSGVCGEPNGLAEGFFLSHEPSEKTKYVCRRCRAECRSCRREITLDTDCVCAHWQLRDAGNGSAECAMECGKGSRVLKPADNNQTVGQCQRCHSFCDPQQSCFGTGAEHCERCAFGGLPQSNGTTLCLQSCPPDFPHPDEEGFCQAHDPGQVRERKRLQVVLGVLLAILLICAVIAFLAHRWLSVKKKYVKEVQMHLPEIPPLDPMKVTQRPNMRRLNLIQINELDFAPGKSTILGQGAFGIVYAGKWRPPGVKVNIPVAIKAISPLESRGLNEEKMLHEASLMHSMQHEHLLSVAGICMGADGIKIATLLRPLGSLLRFFEQYRTQLGSKQLMLYCYQISSAMEYLTNKSVIHRDLAARNVLVKNAVHVEVTDFGLAAMLERPGDSVVISDRVAVKWLAPESLRRQIYNQRTDVWSFGVTCWEILTLGNSPYKDLGLRQDRLSRELANRLEQGYRLPQPANCSQELYEELLNCWLSDPDSRPSFRQIKQRFEQFCRAPHLYVQERQASQRALLDSTSSSDQLAMIARLLKDSDFLDPVNVNPAEYYHQQQSSRASPETVTTADCFLSRPNSASARTPPTKRCGEGMRHNSTGTSASSRYKGDPVSRKWSQPWSLDESSTAGRRTTTDEENYLMPKWGGSLSPKFIDENEEGNDGIEEEPVVEEPVELYTPVVEGAALANAEAAPCQQHSASEQYMNNREYINGVDGTATIDLLTSPLSSAADKGNTYENTGHDGKNNGHLHRQEATKAIGVGGNETAI